MNSKDLELKRIRSSLSTRLWNKRGLEVPQVQGFEIQEDQKGATTFDLATCDPPTSDPVDT